MSGAADRDVPEELQEKRQRMLDKDLAGRDITDARVLDAMAAVLRHEFVSSMQRSAAYDDVPLRIGCGQTISQPYVVAYMTQLLQVEPGMRVLEIGTGSGYQTVVLAAMGAEVFSVERQEDLSYAAENTLDRLGYGDAIALRVDDGTLGWPEEAPFSRIIVTAAGPKVPETLVAQLEEGGRIVMPVGGERGGQRLIVGDKHNGELTTQPVLNVIFVPLIGEEGFGGKR